MTESFEAMGRDISVAFEKFGADINRSNSAAQRAETASKTGIVSERAASLSSLPEYVAKLGPRARVVDASCNAIAQLPDDVGLLTKVHKFNVASNKLTSLPMSFCSLAALKVLRLESNKLEALPAGIGSLSKLEELVLADNNLRVLPASFSKLTRLQRLDLSRNKLEAEADSEAEAEAEAVSSGKPRPTRSSAAAAASSDSRDDDDDPTDRNADASGLRHVGGCVALIELRLDGNAGLQCVPRWLGALASLKILSADHTAVRRVHGEVLRGCAALHTLSVRGCYIDVEELRATPGYGGFEARRQANRSKQIHGQVMIGSRGLDDGLDHAQHASKAIRGAHT